MNSNKSFTLIETLIVVVIIGILSSLIYVGISTTTNKALDAKVQADISHIVKAINTYYNLNGIAYPIEATPCCIDATTGSYLCSSFTSNMSTYLPTIPVHPNHSDAPGACYYYYSDGDKFVLSGSLNQDDYFYSSENGWSDNISQLVSNGSFDTDTGWTKQGVVISNKAATYTGTSSSNYIDQTVSVTNGKRYILHYEIISNALVGSSTLYLSSVSFAGSLIGLDSMVGKHTKIVNCVDDTNGLRLVITSSSTSGTLVLDNVSLKEVY